MEERMKTLTAVVLVSLLIAGVPDALACSGTDPA
jgi:hypothetical protein